MKGSALQNGGDSIETLQPYLLAINQVLPIFWPAYGVWRYIEGSGLTTLLIFIALLWLLAVLGLRLGYVTTVRYYMGAYSAPLMAVTLGNRPKSVPATARKIPLMSDDLSALLICFYKSYIRHPHVRMLLIMPLCFGLFILFMHRSGAYGNAFRNEEAWIPMAGVLWPFFNFSFFMFNIFGIDSASFQALQLLPTSRYKFLLAKNMAIAPVVLGLVIFFVTVSKILTEVPVRAICLSLILAVHIFFLFSVVGNILSIKFPHRLQRDALRMPARRLRMLIMGLVSSLLSVLLMLPALICMLIDRYSVDLFGGKNNKYMPLFFAIMLTLFTIIFYWRALIYTGDVLTAEEAQIKEKLFKESD
jgi:hypothetical protein